MMKGEGDKKAAEPRRVRGTATFHDDMSVEFVPQGKGEPVQRNVKKVGEARFYETDGEKSSSYVAHLKVSRDSSDPVGDMEEQLEKLTANLRKYPLAPTSRRHRCLLDREGLKVWHMKSERQVRVEMNLSTESADMSSVLLNLTSEVNKCLVINKTSLRPQRK